MVLLATCFSTPSVGEVELAWNRSLDDHRRTMHEYLEVLCCVMRVQRGAPSYIAKFTQLSPFKLLITRNITSGPRLARFEGQGLGRRVWSGLGLSFGEGNE